MKHKYSTNGDKASTPVFFVTKCILNKQQWRETSSELKLNKNSLGLNMWSVCRDLGSRNIYHIGEKG